MAIDINPNRPSTLPQTDDAPETVSSPSEQQTENSVSDTIHRGGVRDSLNRPSSEASPLDGAFSPTNTSAIIAQGRRPRGPITQEALRDASTRHSIDTQGKDSRSDTSTTARERVGSTRATSDGGDPDNFTIYAVNPNLPVHIEYNNRDPQTFVIDSLPTDLAEATGLQPGGSYVFVNNGSIPGGDLRNIRGVYQ